MSRNVDLINCCICGKQIKNIGGHLHYSHPELSVKTYYDKYIKKDGEDICPTCEKENSFQSLRKGYTKHCCPKCAQIDKDVRYKQEQTNLSKYGNRFIIATEYAIQKSKQTKKLRYGSETYNNSDKMKQTKIDKYGEYYVNPDKTKQTNLERYGVEYTFQDRTTRLKAIKTQRKNGNKSALEDLLEQFFIKHNIKYEQEYNKDSRYPYLCDFYLPDKDMFIEINGYWTHGGHTFDLNNKKDLDILKKWEEKAKLGLKQYQNAIYIWTKSDVEKVECAKKNKLNYIILWNKKDIENFIRLYKI